jgi:hypothetical protein
MRCAARYRPVLRWPIHGISTLPANAGVPAALKRDLFEGTVLDDPDRVCVLVLRQGQEHCSERSDSRVLSLFNDVWAASQGARHFDPCEPRA